MFIHGNVFCQEHLEWMERDEKQSFVTEFRGQTSAWNLIFVSGVSCAFYKFSFKKI